MLVKYLLTIFCLILLLTCIYNFVLYPNSKTSNGAIIEELPVNKLKLARDECYLSNSWCAKPIKLSSMEKLQTSIIWGSFRPGIYFGMKTKSIGPSIATGILWTSSLMNGKPFRDQTVQDELTRFDWIRHNGKNYGEQRLLDTSYDMDINTSFIVKESITDKENILENKPTWIQKINIDSVNSNDKYNYNVNGQDIKSLIFYYGIECSSIRQSIQCIEASEVHSLKVKKHKGSKTLGYEESISIVGYSIVSGWFHIFLMIEDKEQSSSSSSSSISSSSSSSISSSMSSSISYTGLKEKDLILGVEKIKNDARNLIYSSSNNRNKKEENIFQIGTTGELNNKLEDNSCFIALQINFMKDIRIDVVMYDHLQIQNENELLDLLNISSPFTTIPTTITATTRSLLPPFTLYNQKSISSPALINSDGNILVEDITTTNLNNNFDIMKTTQSMLKKEIDSSLKFHLKAFNKRFQSIFKLEHDSFSGGIINNQDCSGQAALFSPQSIEAAKVCLSSLLGGIGYYQGSSLIQAADLQDVEISENNAISNHIVSNKNPIFSQPINLFTATPSRTAFPRGFLWDEGFHELLISQWDTSITMEVIASWLQAMHFPCSNTTTTTTNSTHTSTTTEDCIGGWIPREMILGEEAMRRVPNEFIVQRVNIANPPTFLLVVDSLLTRFSNVNTLSSMKYKQERDSVFHFLCDIYPLLHKWMQWFLHSQRGSIKYPGSFRWRGRSKSDGKVIPNTLSSGLDDYPRSPIPHPDEHHLDLHCWMTKGTEIMSRLETILKESKEYKLNYDDENILSTTKYDEMYRYLLERMNILHWSDVYKGYFDVGIYNNQSHFSQDILFRCQNPIEKSMIDIFVPVSVILQHRNDFCPETHPMPLQAHGDGKGNYKIMETFIFEKPYILSHIPRVGYVSIYPLLLKLLNPNTTHMGYVLDIIENPDHLWTDYGLRSISKTDIFYRRRNSEGDAPYWRGPIWIPINYLTLSSLYYYSKLSNGGLYTTRILKLYNLLRNNIIQTVIGQYIKTGYFWEQYDDITGEGIRGHPFTGWTSLIVNIMAEKY